MSNPTPKADAYMELARTLAVASNAAQQAGLSPSEVVRFMLMCAMDLLSK